MLIILGMGRRFDLLTGKYIEDYKGKRRAPEAAVGRDIDAYLRSLSIYIRTIKSDGTKTRDGWRKSAQGAGISDRIGVIPGGRFLAVELKAPGKKRTLTMQQFDFLFRIASAGGCACVADSVDDVKRALGQTQAELLAELEKWRPKAAIDQELNFLDTVF